MKKTTKEIRMLAAFELCLGIYCLFLTILDITTASSRQDSSLLSLPILFGSSLIISSIGIFRLKIWARRANNVLAAFILFYAAFGLFLSIHNRKINTSKLLDLSPFVLFSIAFLILFARKKVSEQFKKISQNEIIAERKIIYIKSITEKIPVTIRIGKPYQIDSKSWACPVELAGLHERLADVRAEDSFQALILAIQLLRRLLAAGKILSLENREITVDELFEKGI